eukprot:COSAG06_NODE_13598_length_1240_cov_311.711656_1_plen_286_part_10
MLTACRTGLRCVSAHLRAAPSATAARSGAARAARRGWIGGCHRVRLPGRGHCTAPAPPLLIRPRAADRRCSGRAWRRQTGRAWWISRATCSCAGAPRRHLIAWLRLLAIDLQLDGAMSSPGPAAKLALKRQTGLMGGEMSLAATTATAQAQRSAAAAQPAAAAAAAAAATVGACDLQAFASQSLPVVPAWSSTTGRPVAPHSFFVAGRDRGRGRGRGSPQQWCSQQRWRRRRRRRQRQRRRCSSRNDNRRVGCGAASAMSSTGPATKLALNARGGVWAWCGCFSPV